MTSLEKILALKQKKTGEGISALTAYDYPTARILDEAGVDILLVGDSLGMVVLGFPDTTHVTLAHMLHHIAAVSRANPRALILGDLPIHSYDTPAQAVESSRLLVAAGAEAVKLEGGEAQIEKITAIIHAGIPVCGHLGMLPQSVVLEGGYHKKGKSPQQARQLFLDATALVAAGVFAIVLESVVAELAAEITNMVIVPTIGIGCGTGKCDGEIAVITDLTGGFPWFVPPFARPVTNIAAEIKTAADIYISRVRKKI